VDTAEFTVVSGAAPGFLHIGIQAESKLTLKAGQLNPAFERNNASTLTRPKNQ
jgi:hypothetical protein